MPRKRPSTPAEEPDPRASLPSSAELHEYLKVAIDAARIAARIHEEGRGLALDVRTKSSEVDIVTRVDGMCEQAIRERLLGAYPGHQMLGEEDGAHFGVGHRAEDGAAGRPARGVPRWVVDPLDGTVNYAHGFPFYCVSIGLELDGTLLVGVVLDSVRGELFTAVRGEGAFLADERLSVTDETVLRKALLATGFAYVEGDIYRNLEVFARMLPQARSVRRPGAAALDLCYVACGRLDGFWELSLQPWDVAAATLIVREAGGTVTGADGAPHRLGDPVLVASNGALHTKLLAALQLSPTLA